MRFVTGFIALFSVLAVIYLYSATLGIASDLSPQGCRMSYMYPSYVLQSEFDASWTPLAKRYSLWLYREVNEHGRGWEPTHVADGLPVLFIPGNAGSSRQVRSIASSATRQYFEAPGVVSSEFKSRALKSLDFFAVEFNEDLSAFHGPTIEAQTAYTSRAIAYILSLYPPGTSIIIMGHSMGGIVGTSLLPSPNISAIITMSTPHTLPPARFDARIDMIYDRTQQVLAFDATPIVSLCGGATDMMIPSESCVLPATPQLQPDAHVPPPFRRTVFSSALEGAWTGVGHREMVWCHQLRWRVARAALELHGAPSRAAVLDRWLRDGHALPPPHTPEPNHHTAHKPGVLPADTRLELRNPRGAHTHLLPVPTAHRAKLVLFVSQGAIAPVGPQRVGALAVSVWACNAPGMDEVGCRASLRPTVLKLMPSPVSGRPFPVPKEGADESEGIVLFEADIPRGGTHEWVGVRVENGEGEGWIVGGFVPDEPLINNVKTFQLMLGKVSMALPGSLRTSYEFPNLLSNALLVYRITPRRRLSENPCIDPLLQPLLVHTSHPSETHYFPLTVLPSHRILLHTHSAAPHIRADPSLAPGLRFTVYSSGSVGCDSDLVGLELSVDWSATFGRWASRYFTVVPGWATGVIAMIMFQAWGISDNGAPVPTVQQSLSLFARKPLRRMLLASFLLSLVPLPERYYLGNGGEPMLSAIAPLLLLISSGFVCVSWWVLQLLMWPLGRVGKLGSRRRREETSVHRSTVISMCLIFLLIFLFVPWQVAFLGCWMIHLYICAVSHQHVKQMTPIPDVVAIPLLRRRDDDGALVEEPRRPAAPPPHIAGNHNHNMHLLLLMTWLLPLAAPVLVVWVRTLAVAGLTTPFDGDHFFLSAAPFLILVDFASWTNSPIFEQQSFEKAFSVRWAFVCLGAAGFLLGSRKAYFVFDVAKVAVGLVVLVRVGPRYWGRSAWFSVPQG